MREWADCVLQDVWVRGAADTAGKTVRTASSKLVEGGNITVLCLATGDASLLTFRL